MPVSSQRRAITVEPSEACLAGCQAGSAAAVEELFRTHVGLVEHVLGRLVGPVTDLEDLVQTVFLEALRSLSRYRGDASFKTWLMSITVHVGQHYLRAGKIRRHVPLDVVPDEAIARELDHDRGIDERRLAHELHQALDRLAPNKRIALLLWVVEGQSVDEIARLMGASRTATRSRIFFARRELKRVLTASPRLAAHVAALFEGGAR
jgi:RNA polymerase sigma-70 factor (ECF subfamily)